MLLILNFEPITMFYILLSITTISLMVILINRVDALTYKVVIVFISLIILSNTSAKLFSRFVLKDTL